MENRYCTNCGKALTNEANFCGSCGKEVKQTGIKEIQAESIPASHRLSEKIIGIIPAVTRKKGLLGIESFNIIVTEKRLIFAQMTPEMIKEEAKKQGKEGFINGLLGAMTVGYTLYKRYLDMLPEEALKENTRNFSVGINVVRKVKVEEGRKLNKGSIGVNYEESHLEIETPSEKLKFTVPHNFVETAAKVMHETGLY